MKEYKQFYIDGAWVDPVEPRTLEIENPATEENFAVISIGSKADVDKAVAAARKAFPAFSQTSVEYRAELLEKIAAGIQARMPEMAEAISNEMGAPMWLANAAQVPAGMGHFATTAAILRDYQFEELKGTTLLRKEPIGVCGFITPWNWPLNQIACKVAPAIAAGCTMVLKPSEIAPLDAMILTEIMHEAGVPKGVFNLVNGLILNMGLNVVFWDEFSSLDVLWSVDVLILNFWYDFGVINSFVVIDSSVIGDKINLRNIYVSNSSLNFWDSPNFFIGAICWSSYTSTTWSCCVSSSTSSSCSVTSSLSNSSSLLSVYTK